MEERTCSSGHPCAHRCLGSGSVGYICNYIGYCDFQLPRDSRPMKPLLPAQENPWKECTCKPMLHGYCPVHSEGRSQHDK